MAGENASDSRASCDVALSKVRPSDPLKFGMLLTYFVFGLLLNSVGIVILQMINMYGVSKESASTLEGCKDVPIASVSFLVAPYLSRLGCKNAVLFGLAVVSVSTFAMAYFQTFAMARILFLSAGCAFAFVKVSVYTTVGLITVNEQEHAAFLNMVEGSFMLGVLAGYWSFGHFMSNDDPYRWLVVYYYLSPLCVVTFLVILATPYATVQSALLAYKNGGASGAGQPSSARREFVDMLSLAKLGLVRVFVVTTFLYVLVEQGLGTWLPTFNKEVIKLPSDLSVELTSIFAASLACGRLTAGVLLRLVSWRVLLSVCLTSAVLVIATSLSLARDLDGAAVASWADLPVPALLLPSVGLFLAPVYPALISVVLSALPKEKHASMTGLLTMFSALGGSTGSIITGFAFAAFDGRIAFHLAIPALLVILWLVQVLRSLTRVPTDTGEPTTEADDPAAARVQLI